MHTTAYRIALLWTVLLTVLIFTPAAGQQDQPIGQTDVADGRELEGEPTTGLGAVD